MLGVVFLLGRLVCIFNGFVVNVRLVGLILICMLKNRFLVDGVIDLIVFISFGRLLLVFFMLVMMVILFLIRVCVSWVRVDLFDIIVDLGMCMMCGMKLLYYRLCGSLVGLLCLILCSVLIGILLISVLFVQFINRVVLFIYVFCVVGKLVSDEMLKNCLWVCGLMQLGQVLCSQ